jgi:hypothetical protein
MRVASLSSRVVLDFRPDLPNAGLTVHNSGSGLSEALRAQVLAAFERLGTARLTPVYEAMAGPVSYEELRLLQVFLLARLRGSQE